jgi:hypothetical protein
MKKLRLESIQVESYETSGIPDEVGTIRGNVATLTCFATCGRSCVATDCGSCQSGSFCC